MPVDFLNISKKSLKTNLLQKAASFLDEKNEDVRESVNYIIPLIYSAIFHSVNKGKTSDLYSAIKNFEAQSITTTELEDLFKGQNSLLFDKSYSFLKLIFNDGASEVKKLIADASGIHKESVISLQKMILPLVLKPISKHIEDENLDEMGFESTIASHKNDLYKHISTDFLNKLVHDVGFYTLDYNTVNNNDFKTNRNNNRKNVEFLKLLSGIVLVSLVGWFIFKSLNQKEKTKTPERAKQISNQINLKEIADITLDDDNLFYFPTEETLGKYIKNHENLGFFKKRTLKNGKEIIVLSKGGVNNFINYLEDNKPVNKKVWFDLNRVLVKGKDDFDLSKSKCEIENLLDVLAAYPNIGIKIGGMTDNEGPADINFQKSFKIAKKFMNLLIEKGINPDRLNYEGYGENYPIKDNDSDQKHLNNRLSFRLSKK